MHMYVTRTFQYKQNTLIDRGTNTCKNGAIAKPEDHGTNRAHKIGTTSMRADKHSISMHWLLHSTIAIKEIIVDTSTALPT